MDSHEATNVAYGDAVREHVRMMDERIINTIIVSAAEVAHEVNRAYCRTINDFSQLPWSECEEWQRESAIKGVKHAMANRDATPRSMHEAWMKSKREDGWEYGIVKDPTKKTHPCMVDYEHLPHDQRTKDHLFLAVVRTMLKGVK